jgi:ATP-dependent Clp protease ATP-binding subunit ClpB
MQLEIEEAALKKEKDKLSAERLAGVRAELSELRESFSAMKLRWEREKESITEAQKIREQIDEVSREIEIAEGKYHQVKRMCEKVGKNVLFLKRIAIGQLQLDENLKCGQVRELTAGEMALFGW